jgi:hypothetical protein
MQIARDDLDYHKDKSKEVIALEKDLLLYDIYKDEARPVRINSKIENMLETLHLVTETARAFKYSSGHSSISVPFKNVLLKR